jgi:flagellar biosynthesis protein FlhG
MAPAKSLVEPDEFMAEPTTIIPIAGGKGGVGKSFVTANLAVALARRGHRTIAVDLDLGNSNLHTLLGLENRYHGVGEYLRGTVKCAPTDLIVETSVPGLGFIPGDGRMPFMANITYNQKLAIFRLVKALPARYILLDLSAGTAYNTLDLFQFGKSGILVTTPERPALMSALVFMKNLVLRAIDQKLRRGNTLKDRLNEMAKQSVNDPVFTVEKFRRDLAQDDPEAAAAIEEICRRIRPRIVYNMVEDLKDTEIFSDIDRTLTEVLSIQCDHFGVVPYDQRVRQFLKEPGIFLIDGPKSSTADTIDRLGHRVVHLWDTPLEGSAEVLTEYTRKVLPDENQQLRVKARA